MTSHPTAEDVTSETDPWRTAQIHTVALLGASCGRCGVRFALAEKVVYVEQTPVHFPRCNTAWDGVLAS